jgi:hypothetical protein
MRRADERLDPANHNGHTQAGVDPINQQDRAGTMLKITSAVSAALRF